MVGVDGGRPIDPRPTDPVWIGFLMGAQGNWRKPTVECYVRRYKLKSFSDRTKADQQTKLSARALDYLDRDEIILLGDPGAGKTHLFKSLAVAEKAAYYTVPQFVARNGDSSARTV
jgi:hypothetical protein